VCVCVCEIERRKARGEEGETKSHFSLVLREEAHLI